MDKRNNKKLVIASWVVIVAILCVVLAILFNLFKGNEKPVNGNTPGTELLGSEASSEHSFEQTISTDPQGVNQGSAGNQSQNSNKENGASEGSQSTPSSPTASEKTSENQKDTSDVEKIDSSFERQLAAGLIYGVSMQYADFDFKGIYLTAETKMENKMDSQGVYIIFTSQGQEYAVCAKPLEAERKESGMKDLYTYNLGFNTFDLVDVSNINTSSMIEVNIEDLTEEINQTILPSIYEH